MYALIRGGGSFIGFFSSKKKMRTVIEALIQSDYERTGNKSGCYHFRYAKINIDEPWFGDSKNDEISTEGRAILSLSTMHTEYFTHKVKTDWSTGEIISMDADSCSNV